VTATVPQAEQLEVESERVLRLRAEALGHVARGNDEVVIGGRAPVGPIVEPPRRRASTPLSNPP
jgi:hypothetical protein